MTKIVVDIPGTHRYSVRIASKIDDQLIDEINSISSDRTVALITDTNVADLYLEAFKEQLQKANYKLISIVLPAGEEAKSVACADEVWQAMADNKLSRDSLVIALGGGVVGDLAGFVASTYMRGIPVVQVPTTLLSMVDSSVGGKTALNLPAGKNLVGTFYQPAYVHADIASLVSLPQREWACGCAEIVKSAVMDGDEFFFWLLDKAQALAARDLAVTQQAVVKSILFKAGVVAQDQRETKGIRECLNYGHTLAHAIENEAGYGTYSHGAAVAEGMRFAARMAATYFDLPLDFAETQDELLDMLDLAALNFRADPQVMLDHLFSDKKVRNHTLRFVLPRDVGKWEIVSLTPEFVLQQLEEWQNNIE